MSYFDIPYRMCAEINRYMYFGIPPLYIHYHYLLCVCVYVLLGAGVHPEGRATGPLTDGEGILYL
jgi:hypothetical protein